MQKFALWNYKTASTIRWVTVLQLCSNGLSTAFSQTPMSWDHSLPQQQTETSAKHRVSTSAQISNVLRRTIETSQLAHRDVTSRQRCKRRSFVNGAEIVVESRFQQLQHLPTYNILQLVWYGHTPNYQLKIRIIQILPILKIHKLPLFQDNPDKPAPKMLNQSGF